MNKVKVSYNKTNYFKVPDNYFAKNETELQRKIDEIQPKKSNYHKIIWGLTSTAAIVTACFFIWKSSGTYKVKSTDLSCISTIDKKIIEEYLLENLNENEIIQMSIDHKINIESLDFISYQNEPMTTHTHQKNKPKLDTSINKDDIIEYLNDENIEIESL